VRPRLTLGARIFLLTALLVTLAVGAAVVVTYVLGNQVAKQTARQALQRASSVQSALQQQRFEQLRLIAQVSTADVPFTAIVAEAVGTGDNLSLLDQLEERQNNLGYDFGMVLDPQGVVLARSDRPDVSGQDLSQRPLVAGALEELEAFGFWEQDGRLFNAVVVPITADRLLVGFLMAGFAITDVDALEIRRVSDAEVVFVTAPGGTPRIAASTLEAARGEELLASLQGQGMADTVMRRGESMDQIDLELRGRRWIGLVRPVGRVEGAPIGAVVSLASLDDQLRPFRDIQTILLAVGAAAILFASLFSFLLSRRVMKPVRDLATAAEAASQGNYSQRIELHRSDEVGRLADAFNKLLSDLREKQDMETYITDLSRSLPSSDGGGGGGALEEAGTRPVALLGVDLRRYAQARIGYDPGATLDHVARDLRRVHAAAGARNGRVEGSFGQRVLVSFEGENRAYRALQAAAEIGAALAGSGSAFDDDEPPILALAEGEAVTGSVVWGEGPERVVVGRPLLLLEGLLREGAPGDIILSPPLYAELAEVFARSGAALAPQRGMLGGTQSLYVLNGALAGRVAGVTVASAAALEAPTLEHPVSASSARTVAPAEREPATLAEIAPGRVLGDRFEILSTLGAGGMGVVYKVRDRELDDLVALKMLKRDLWGDRELLDRLKSELKLARKITHPNVLRTFDFGDVDGIPFITMEYVRGITLRYLLSQTGALPYSAGLRLARQLCRGLAAAHDEGVLHRDIKPENLIVMPNGNAKLMDFGIARPTTRMAAGQTQPGTVIGTPQYLAPELLQGAEADERADLYACGVVLYEIFTARTPFSGANPMQIIVSTLNDTPTPPRQHWAEMPEALEQIILRCLEKDPARRYRTAAALLVELEALRA
jgi:eukaryotic-like serine/threonine-protein kinase